MSGNRHNKGRIQKPSGHYLDGKWYIYYTATDVHNDSDASRFVFVLENASKDPLKGEWTDKGKINTEYSGLDGSIFEYHNNRYFLYSAYVGAKSVLVICEMINPWTLSDKQNIIAVPEFDWEKKGGRQILEGPQFLEGPKEKIFIVYSASACWADEYSLGLLTANTKADLMEPASWIKSAVPVFSMSSENSVYAAGHNSFFKSPDGEEDWILYHATSLPDQKCKNRSPRAQKFIWKKDGTPDFGLPDKAGVSFKNPSK
jgi:GH43 family beta-xylosidase